MSARWSNGCAIWSRTRAGAPDDFGIESWVSIRGRSQDEWIADVEAWKALGATHVSVNTMKAGLASPQDHIDAIARFKEAVG